MVVVANKRINYKKLQKKVIHRIIMEKYLGRPLEKDEIVHHIDENKLNFKLRNLELCLKSIHARFHQQKGDYFDITKRKRKGYKHGTYSCWRNTGCKCEKCIQAQRKYKKKYRRNSGIH